MNEFNYKNTIFALLAIFIGCKATEEVPLPEKDPPPIANFGFYPDANEFRSSVRIIDSTKYAVLYKINYGDGHIYEDSIPTDNYGKDLHSPHVYTTLSDTVQVFDIKLTVTNAEGLQDSITRQFTIQPYPPEIPDVNDSTCTGFYNAPGILSGLINGDSVSWESNDSTLFSGSLMHTFSSGTGGYVYAMMFSRGLSPGDIKESFVMLLPTYGHQYFEFERNPPDIQYKTLKDSLYVGKSLWFYYLKPRESDNADDIFKSKIDAKLIDIKEIAVDPNFYYSVYTKGYEATFSIKSSEFITLDERNKTADLSVDIILKMQLLFNRRTEFRSFIALPGLIKFCGPRTTYPRR